MLVDPRAKMKPVLEVHRVVGSITLLSGCMIGWSIHILCNMKTIAVTIDEPTLERMDRIVSAKKKANRSALIRLAIQDYVTRLERIVEEEHERNVFKRHRKRLEHQAAALVKEQAKP